MKKIVPILLAMVLALTLCLVGFADAERYDDDPLEETAVPTSEAVLEEAEPVPARSSECAKCGEMLDAGENSKIIFEIMNEGRNPVYNIVPLVETVGKVKHLGISPSVMIEEILPGEGIRYTASIHAGEKLKDGEVTFRVAVADENGIICDSQEFTLPTQR